METKSFTQYAISMIVGVVTAIVICLVTLLTKDAPPTEEIIGISVVVLICVISGLLMYKMTIFVDDSYVYFRMGIGLIGKSYEIKEIEECIPAKLKYSGIGKLNSSGIEKIKNGWSYRISGYKAVDLRFVESNKIVRLGTKNPEEVCKAINDAISKKTVSKYKRNY